MNPRWILHGFNFQLFRCFWWLDQTTLRWNQFHMRLPWVDFEFAPIFRKKNMFSPDHWIAATILVCDLTQKNPKFFNPTEVFCEGYWWENITLLLSRLFQHWNINHFHKPHASAKPSGCHPFKDPPWTRRQERKLSSERQVRCFLREVGMMLDDLSRLTKMLRGTPTWKTPTWCPAWVFA